MCWNAFNATSAAKRVARPPVLPTTCRCTNRRPRPVRSAGNYSITRCMCRDMRNKRMRKLRQGDIFIIFNLWVWTYIVPSVLFIAQRVQLFINNYDHLCFFARIYVIISLWRLPNQCPKREIIILRKDTLTNLTSLCVLKTSWLKTVLLRCRVRVRHIKTKI